MSDNELHRSSAAMYQVSKVLSPVHPHSKLRGILRQNKGSALIPLIAGGLVVLGILIYLFSQGLLKLPSSFQTSQSTNKAGESSGSSLLKEEYSNPFDEKSQYQNPFSTTDSDYSNPFEGL